MLQGSTILGTCQNVPISGASTPGSATGEAANGPADGSPNPGHADAAAPPEPGRREGNGRRN
eukprot:4173967-Prymnesium_polylepis.1